MVGLSAPAWAQNRPNATDRAATKAADELLRCVVGTNAGDDLFFDIAHLNLQKHELISIRMRSCFKHLGNAKVNLGKVFVFDRFQRIWVRHLSDFAERVMKLKESDERSKRSQSFFSIVPMT